MEDDGYSQPPVPSVVVAAAAAPPGVATDPWADFQQPKKSFYSSSESDSGRKTVWFSWRKERANRRKNP
jgi:hypothetical protein